MLVYSSYDYIVIGLTLRILRHVNPRYTKSTVLHNLDTLFKGLEQSGFQVSIAYRESRFYTQMEEDLTAFSEDADLSPALCSTISRVTRSLEDVIFAESSTKKVYVLPDRRYNSDYFRTYAHASNVESC